MADTEQKYNIQDLGNLLEHGLETWKNDQDSLGPLAESLNTFMEQISSLPEVKTPGIIETAPENIKHQNLVLLGTLHYITGVLGKTRAELQEANLSYEEVLGLLTHEFKNLLSTLDGYQRIMEHDLQRLDQKEMLETNRAGNRIVKKLFNILESILKFYQSDRKLLRPDYKLTDFEEDILQPLEREYEADLKSHDMQIKRSAKGPLKMVSIDPQLIEIAMRNLIENAIKYSQPGSKIEITHRFSEKNLDIRVKSYNTAIPQDLCVDIFEKFKTKKIGNAKTGTGIGLYNVRNIIHLHHGTIKCRSKTGRWIVFEICLPIQNS